MRNAGSLVSSSALAFVTALAACGGTPSDVVDVGVKESSDPRIIGGSPSTSAQDATVFINLSDGFCSGSLITPNLVLTARHCVSQMAGNDDCQHFTTDDNPTTMGIVLGVTANESQNPTVAAHGIKLFHETNNSGCSYDIALIQLDHDLTGAAIAPVRLTKATTSDVGVAIGYGDGDDNGDMTNGRYQRNGVAVFAVGPATYTYKTTKNQSIPVTVSPGELLTGESTCYGDSGGPLYDATGSVIGVTSRGVDQYCIDRPTVWSDVYSHATLILNAAMTAGHPLASAPGGSDAGASSSGSSGSGTSGSSGSGTSGSSGSGASGSSGSGASGSSGAAGSSGLPSSGLGSSGSSGTSGTGEGEAPPQTIETTTAGGCAAAPSRANGREGSLFVVALGALALVVSRRRRSHGV